MFKKFSGLMAVLVCFVWLSYALAGGPNMKEGLWEITMKMEMPGMPMKMPPQTKKVDWGQVFILAGTLILFCRCNNFQLYSANYQHARGYSVL